MEMKFVVVNQSEGVLGNKYRTKDGEWSSHRELAHDFGSEDVAQMVARHISLTNNPSSDDIFSSAC